MLKEVELLICLVFLLFSILLIFNARFIVRSKLDKSNENTKVLVIKWIGYVLAVLSLFFIYYFVR